MALIRAGMSSLKTISLHENVFKEECAFSYDTPFSSTGLFLNMTTMRAYADRHLALDHAKTGTVLYLHFAYTKVPKASIVGEQTEPTKLAIGVDGGFQTEPQFDISKIHSLVVMPQKLFISLPNADLPEIVIQACDAAIAHSGALHQQEVAAWQEEPLVVSKYAKDLVQLDPQGRQISPNPADWVCEESGHRENLWLNLSDGYIGSGRRNWDGSGGTGAALAHYEATGSKYPLAVKLGTITPQGADVFSYAPDENDLVEDPYLAEHLSHWGIDAMKMEKTEKSMAELNVALNKTFEFDKITEAGAKLEPLSGAGYMGLKNLGNSCYMNSVMQVLYAIPEVERRYAANAQAFFEQAGADPESNFHVQMAKLGVGLCTDQYSSAAPAAGEKSPSVEPRTFKHLVGKGHSEFSSGRQQDACEYLQHILEVMSRAERAAGSGGAGAPSTSSLFKFNLQDRIQCLESGQVTYKTRAENVLGLEIAMECATNKEQVEEYQAKRQKMESDAKAEEVEVVRPVVPFDACLSLMAQAEVIPDFFSTATGRKGAASKSVRFASFPPYLAVQMRRYFVAPDWTAKKRDVLVEAPEVLDLQALRGTGILPGETPLPEAEEAVSGGTPAAPVPDEAIVAQLMTMGFGENGCKRAALATSNVGAEAAMEWVFAHMEDADFNDPLPAPGAADAAAAGAAPVDPESVGMLSSMGFTTVQAEGALKATSGNLERAADWLFSHSDDLDAALAGLNGAAAGGGGGGAAPNNSETTVIDGAGLYELMGFISHMGSNTGCGHYVCHIKKDGRWVLYNDEKVAVSQTPPKDLGYVYIYRRKAP